MFYYYQSSYQKGTKYQMSIAILSDTHGSISTTTRALSIIAEHPVELILHCGDITTPAVIELFAGLPSHFVYGNMDFDKAGLKTAASTNNLPEPRQSLSLTPGGVPIAVAHGHEPHILQSLIDSGSYRYVFHGHSHLRRDDRAGSTRVINPGALGGRRPQSRSICFVDLTADRVEFVEIEE